MGSFFGGGPSNRDVRKQQAQAEKAEKSQLEAETRRMMLARSRTQMQGGNAPTNIRLGTDQDVDGAGLQLSSAPTGSGGR